MGVENSQNINLKNIKEKSLDETIKLNPLNSNEKNETLNQIFENIDYYPEKKPKNIINESSINTINTNKKNSSNMTIKKNNNIYDKNNSNSLIKVKNDIENSYNIADEIRSNYNFNNSLIEHGAVLNDNNSFFKNEDIIFITNKLNDLENESEHYFNNNLNNNNFSENFSKNSESENEDYSNNLNKKIINLKEFDNFNYSKIKNTTSLGLNINLFDKDKKNDENLNKKKDNFINSDSIKEMFNGNNNFLKISDFQKNKKVNIIEKNNNNIRKIYTFDDSKKKDFIIPIKRTITNNNNKQIKNKLNDSIKDNKYIQNEEEEKEEEEEEEENNSNINNSNNNNNNDTNDNYEEEENINYNNNYMNNSNIYENEIEYNNKYDKEENNIQFRNSNYDNKIILKSNNQLKNNNNNEYYFSSSSSNYEDDEKEEKIFDNKLTVITEENREKIHEITSSSLNESKKETLIKINNDDNINLNLLNKRKIICNENTFTKKLNEQKIIQQKKQSFNDLLKAIKEKEENKNNKNEESKKFKSVKYISKYLDNYIKDIQNFEKKNLGKSIFSNKKTTKEKKDNIEKKKKIKQLNTNDFIINNEINEKIINNNKKTFLNLKEEHINNHEYINSDNEKEDNKISLQNLINNTKINSSIQKIEDSKATKKNNLNTEIMNFQIFNNEEDKNNNINISNQNNNKINNNIINNINDNNINNKRNKFKKFGTFHHTKPLFINDNFNENNNYNIITQDSKKKKILNPHIEMDNIIIKKENKKENDLFEKKEIQLNINNNNNDKRNKLNKKFSKLIYSNTLSLNYQGEEKIVNLNKEDNYMINKNCEITILSKNKNNINNSYIYELPLQINDKNSFKKNEKNKVNNTITNCTRNEEFSIINSPNKKKKIYQLKFNFYDLNKKEKNKNEYLSNEKLNDNNLSDNLNNNIEKSENKIIDNKEEFKELIFYSELKKIIDITDKINYNNKFCTLNEKEFNVYKNKEDFISNKKPDLIINRINIKNVNKINLYKNNNEEKLIFFGIKYENLYNDKIQNKNLFFASENENLILKWINILLNKNIE